MALKSDYARHILIISHDIVGKQMAGPGIRAYQLARVLARRFEVVLAAPSGSMLAPQPGLAVLVYDSGEDPGLQAAAHEAAAVLVSSVWLARVPWLTECGVPLIIDGYDPCLAEMLSQNVGEPQALHEDLTLAYLAGDFFICASERQRDWWLGLLEANGRINTLTYRDDPSLRRLVDVVPYGLPAVSPQHTARIIKGVWPGIADTDRVILWGGGLWPWLDADSAIRAMAALAQQRDDVRLLFPGTGHPNPLMSNIAVYSQAARRTAQELGVLDKFVFFGGWIPYSDWPNVLLESDVALILHHDTFETRLAYRSRMLDYIWASLPIISTRGEATGEIVERHGLGTLVGFEDVDGVARAISTMLDVAPADWQPRFDAARRALTWEKAAGPLEAFCCSPRRAPDKTEQDSPVGNAFYRREQRQRLADKAAWGREKAVLEGERERLQTLVDGYERGRFIRLMRWLQQTRRSIRRSDREAH